MARFSVNKLGEYLFANAARRRRLIIDQKYPAPFIVTRYAEARDIMIEYFISNYDPQVINTGIQQITNTPATSDFQINDKAASIRALQSILQMPNKPILNGLTLTRIPTNNLLNINGVDISVNPDILVEGSDRKGTFYGAIKLHISSSNSLTNDSMMTVATLEHSWIEAFYCNLHATRANKKYCLSLDVFSQNVVSTPNATTQRMTNIELSCDEIARIWPAL